MTSSCLDGCNFDVENGKKCPNIFASILTLEKGRCEGVTGISDYLSRDDIETLPDFLYLHNPIYLARHIRSRYPLLDALATSHDALTLFHECSMIATCNISPQDHVFFCFSLTLFDYVYQLLFLY
jgi:hypothetical protein